MESAGPKVPDAVVKAQENMLRLVFGQLVAPTVIDAESLDELFPGAYFREIAALVVELFSDEQQVESDRLYARLSPSAMELLAVIESVGLENLAEDSEEIFIGCRTSVKKYAYSLQSQKLKNAMAQAQKDGDSELHSQLQMEYFELKKNEKKL